MVSPLEHSPRFLQVGDVVVDFERNTVFRDGKSIKVEPKPLSVLQYLIAHSDRFVSLSELREEVWGVTVVDEAVQRAISQLRSAFDDPRSEASIIETIPRRGYRLTARPQQLPHREPSGEARRGGMRFGYALAFVIGGLLGIGAVLLVGGRVETPMPELAPPAPSREASESAVAPETPMPN